MRKKVSGLAWLPFFVFLVLAALIEAASVSARAYASSTRKVNVIIPVTYTADHVDVTLKCKLEYEENENQIITNDTLYLEDGEEGSFVITYTAPGNYYCQLYQIKGSADHVIYDEHIIYLATSITEDSDGKLYADAVLYEDGSDKLPSAYFINYEETTETEEPEETEITVTKEETEEPGETEIVVPPETKEPKETETAAREETEPATTPGKETETSGETDQTEANTPVKTADDAPSAEPYIVLMLLAVFAASAVLVYRKRGM